MNIFVSSIREELYEVEDDDDKSLDEKVMVIMVMMMMRLMIMMMMMMTMRRKNYLGQLCQVGTSFHCTKLPFIGYNHHGDDDDNDDDGDDESGGDYEKEVMGDGECDDEL